MIPLILGSALKRILDALKWCAERPAIAVAVASLVLAGFFYVKSNHLSEKLENARAEIAQMVNERKEAIRYATAEKARIEKEQKAAAEQEQQQQPKQQTDGNIR